MFSFFLLAPNDRGYGHLAVTGAKLPEFTSASQ
jgi:hypothetical protein